MAYLSNATGLADLAGRLLFVNAREGHFSSLKDAGKLPAGRYAFPGRRRLPPEVRHMTKTPAMPRWTGRVKGIRLS